MIQGRLVSEAKELNIVTDIFCKVSLNPLLQYTNTKDTIIQAIVYEGAEYNNPAAAACMVLKEEVAKILSIAVLPEFRGKAYGEFLLRMMIDKAKTSGIQRITLSCDDRMSVYFQKFGFIADGKEIDSNGIVCISMTYKEIGGKCCSKSI